jgi:transcriptional regulator with XRE-family HTH domain
VLARGRWLRVIDLAGCHVRHVSGLTPEMAFDQHYRVGMPADQSTNQRIADAIKAGRKTLGWTQKDLFERSGVSIETIKRYENAKSPRPELDHIRAIFTALKVDRREIPVILGFATREEMGLPPEPARIYSATTQEIAELLEDPSVSDAEKNAHLELLRARSRSRPGQARRRAS